METDIYDRAEALIRLAAKKGLTIATAESCTGGGIGQALTAIPGSSSVFLGGIIAYSNTVKADILGIPIDMLKDHGAVSEPVAKSMAENARKLMNADIAVSVTGIAGPGGGTEAKPVGLVYIALAQAHVPTTAHVLKCGNAGREIVRNQTILTALDVVIAQVRPAD